jgi:hypothetical protein
MLRRLNRLYYDYYSVKPISRQWLVVLSFLFKTRISYCLFVDLVIQYTMLRIYIWYSCTCFGTDAGV